MTEILKNELKAEILEELKKELQAEALTLQEERIVDVLGEQVNESLKSYLGTYEETEKKIFTAINTLKENYNQMRSNQKAISESLERHERALSTLQKILMEPAEDSENEESSIEALKTSLESSMKTLNTRIDDSNKRLDALSPLALAELLKMQLKEKD